MQSEETSIHNKKVHHLNNKQIAYLTARIQGKSKEESKRLAKYSSTTSTTLIESNPNMRQALLSCMQNVGLTEQYLADKLMKGLNAKKTQYFSKDGVVIDKRELDDGDLQHKYFRDTIEIRGDIKQSTIENLNLGLISIPDGRSVDEWNNDLNSMPQNEPIQINAESDSK